MKKRNMLKNVKNKTLIAATAIAVSGLLSAGAAFAQGELVAELVAEQGTVIAGKPGEMILVPVNVFVNQRGNQGTAAVTVTVNFEGKPAKQITFEANEFNIKKKVILEYTIPTNVTDAIVTPDVKMTSSHDKSGNDQVTNNNSDPVTIQVIHAPSDSTAPTVTAVPDRIPDFGGWYSKDVIVSFSATDEAGGSGLATVSDPISVTADGTHTVTGTATDNAGNEGTGSTVIRLDKTAPSLSSLTDVQPNGAGWYNQDINVNFTASDATSGIASKSESVSLTGDAVHSVDGFAEDAAGNKTTDTFEYKIDKTAPTISHTLLQQANEYGWHNTAVDVLFSAEDNLSGVAESSSNVTLSEDGEHEVTNFAKDAAGNETAETFTVKIDRTGPAITAHADKEANEHGWYNEDIEVSFQGTDSRSGLAAISGPVSLTEDDKHIVTGTATDHAGNEVSEDFMFNVDKTAPVVTAAAEREPDRNGWYNEAVNVLFNATDNLSGIVEEIEPVTLNEGKDQAVTRSVTDFAGNIGSASVEGLNVDLTVPSISSHIDKQANEHGWYNENVTVSFSGTDELSGFDKESESSVTLTEGADQTAEGSVSDIAGNAASTKVTGLNIDTTAPVVTAVPDREANKHGWYNNDVGVEFEATDNLSGVASVSGPIQLTEEKEHSITGTATDVAGNVGSGAFDVKIDKTAPTAGYELSQQPNELGWYNKEVTVSFTGIDELSGIAETSESITLSESTEQSASGYVVDKAGNETSIFTEKLNIDTTDPELVLPDNVAFTLNEKASWSASDALSGLASAASGTFDTSKAGSHTTTIEVTDKAGNVTTQTVKYTVSYDYSGVLKPISNDGDSVFKAGRTIPVKFQLKDADGAYVTDAIASIKYVKVSTSVDGEAVDAVSTSAATTGNLFRYDPADDQYIFNLDTKGMSAGTYTLVIYLNDGSKHFVTIGLK